MRCVRIKWARRVGSRNGKVNLGAIRDTTEKASGLRNALPFPADPAETFAKSGDDNGLPGTKGEETGSQGHKPIIRKF
jgi:hypothetical protein